MHGVSSPATRPRFHGSISRRRRTPWPAARRTPSLSPSPCARPSPRRCTVRRRPSGYSSGCAAWSRSSSWRPVLHGSASNHACNCSVTLTNGSGRRRSRLTFRPGRPQADEELLERRHRRVLRFRDRLVGDVHDALLMHPHLPKQPDRIERRRQFGAGSGRILGEAMRVLILIVAEHPGAGACRVVQALFVPDGGGTVGSASDARTLSARTVLGVLR